MRIGHKFLMSAATISATAILLSACSTEVKTLHGYVPPSPKIVKDVSVHESGRYTFQRAGNFTATCTVSGHANVTITVT